ncbi:hypothetical protein CAF53_02560 [Sphingobium sp. LB126]|uniref:DUF5983 family protein n=1 Tax=Sphingobium sp. LB126 TaxID=1983755 RepID=UPI000C2083AB|nr:hypothetical protein [Sphingobium sp. LB126]PJG47244.1 hypothetical protein CAF53_02560 [Sphingobium sp. LB126]
MRSFTKHDLVQLLARAHDVIQSPANFSAALIAEVQADLASVQEHLETQEVPWSLDIHVGHIDHQAGFNFYAGLSRAALMAQMAVHCREWWQAINVETDPRTLSDEATVLTYFNHHPEEYFATECISIDGHEMSDEPVIETSRLLVLSTFHLRQTTAAALEIAAKLPPEARLLTIGDTGWGFLAITPPTDRLAQIDIPADLRSALTFASVRGCQGLLFDRDAPAVDTLATFDW